MRYKTNNRGRVGMDQCRYGVLEAKLAGVASTPAHKSAPLGFPRGRVIWLHVSAISSHTSPTPPPPTAGSEKRTHSRSSPLRIAVRLVQQVAKCVALCSDEKVAFHESVASPVLLLLLLHMTDQDVVVSEMGIAAGSALPGPRPALLACRGAAAGAMSLRQTYLDLAAATARSGSCTWVDAMRASSPTRSRAAADEFTAWMVSSLSLASPCHASPSCAVHGLLLPSGH
jgi:hypothetical protein